ncbi:MAG: NfeD family protein [Alphaproteobacteria bacterium]|nr:NfeD family protein [Alphaproteobacteria bacterium]
MTALDGITFWHWFILGGVLMVLEMVLPVFVFLFIGAAAVVTGLMVFFFPGIGWEQQVLVFAVLAVAAAVAGRMWVRSRPTATDQPALNRRGRQYVGRVFTLEEPIVNGVGKLSVDDTVWKVGGEDLATGCRVKVTGVDGVILLVERDG